MAGMTDPWSSGSNQGVIKHGDGTYGGGDVPGYKPPTTWPGKAAPDPGATPAGKAAAAGQPAPVSVAPPGEKPAPKPNTPAGTPDDLASYLGSMLGDFADAPMLSDDGKTRVSATDLAASIYKRKPEELNNIQGMLYRAGYYTAGTKWPDVAKGQVDDGTLKAWATMLRQTAAQGSANPNKGWRDVLTGMAKTGGAGGTGPDTKTDTATGTTDDTKTTNDTERTNAIERSHTSDTKTDTKFSDPVTAHALVVKAMQDKLGRDPTEGELTQFRGALHDYEAANPTITQTTADSVTKTQGITNTKDTTHTTGSQGQTTTTKTPGTAADKSIPSTLGSTTFPSDEQKKSSGDVDLTDAFAGLQGKSDADVKAGKIGGDSAGATTTPGTSTNQAQWSNTNVDSSRDVNKVSNSDTQSSQNSTQSGGTDPADWAQFYVQEQNRPEMDEYHKGTMYYNAALQVLGLGGR